MPRRRQRSCVAAPRARSALDLGRHEPRARPSGRRPSASGPKPTRRSERTGRPTASHIRRTWRLRPSCSVSSSSCGPSRRTCAGAVRAVVELDARRAAARSAPSPTRGPPTLRDVRLGHAEARMREAVREVAVVGQQDQAARVGVEAPDRVEPPVAGRRDEVDDGRAAVRVAGGGDDARRLVERVDDAHGGRRADALAVDLDALAAGRRRAPGRSRPRRRRSRARRRRAARRRAARRRRRGRGAWRDAWRDARRARACCHHRRARWTSNCSTRRSTTPASPPTAPARRGRGQARGAAGWDAMTDLPARCARGWPSACRSRRSSSSTRRPLARRHGQGAVPHRRRPPGRGGADALPRRPPLALPVLAVRLPADMHVLRDRRDELRPQPDARGRSSTRRCTSAASRTSTTASSWAWASR